MNQHWITVVRTVAAFGLGSIGLIACGGSTGGLGEAPTLSGQVSDWGTIGAAGTLQAFINGNKDMVVTTGSIDAAGNFSIVLPRRDALASYAPEKTFSAADLAAKPPCTGGYQVSPLTFASAVLTLNAVSGTKSLVIGQKIPSTTSPDSYELVSYIYVDREVNETGQSDCPTSGGIPAQTTVYDTHLQAGWNQLISSVNTTAGKSVIRIYTGPVPASAIWF